MESGLGHDLELGLESLPRLARSGRAIWPGGLGSLGPSTAVGDAAAAPTAVGTRSQPDVEPHCKWLGIL